jgi:hypothetical protein
MAMTVALVTTSILFVGIVYLLGFRLGGEHWLEELSSVRKEALQAERRLHELTRQAFAAMAEESQRRGQR